MSKLKIKMIVNNQFVENLSIFSKLFKKSIFKSYFCKINFVITLKRTVLKNECK